MPKPQKVMRKVGSGDGKTCGPSAPASNESSQDPFENFEVELLWCIQQLESSLNSRKMNPRTAEDSIKALNTLKSNKAPLIKKRQVMRTLFGDYRAKMAVEEKKLYKANSNLKFAPSSSGNKSKFLKKSSSLLCKSDEECTATSLNTNAVPVNEDMSCDSIMTSEASADKATLQTDKKSFTFRPSDNQFRFNFSSSGEDVKS